LYYTSTFRGKVTDGAGIGPVGVITIQNSVVTLDIIQAFNNEENNDILDTSFKICISPENGVTDNTFNIPMCGNINPGGGFVGKNVA
jgi:hypothetical protein